MNHLFPRPIFLLLVVLLAAVLPVHSSTEAQQQFDPIIFLMGGDLWSWQGPDQPLVQLTGWGMNRQPVMSPDGTRVAYLSWAQLFADWAATQFEGGGGFTPPTNIWILDIPSSQTYRIADQPEDAVYNGPGDDDPGKYFLRTQPSWSPDGRRLVWLQIQIDTLSATASDQTGFAQLVIYDLASKTTSILESFVVTDDSDYLDLYDVQWGRSGIAFKVYVVTTEPSQQILRLYDDSGTLIKQFTYAHENTNTLIFSVWIRDQEQDYLFPDYLGADMWLNWQTEQIEPMSGIPELVSLTAPDGARFFGQDGTWHLQFPGEEAIDLGRRTGPYGISPDGQWVVYGRDEMNDQTGFFEDKVIVQSKDESFEIGQYRNPTVLWGPVGWQIRQ